YLMAARKKIKAELKEVLVEYDGPQLLLLRSAKDRDMLAVAVEKEPMRQAFFTCEVRQKVLHKYFSEKVDLRFVFEQGYRHYFFDLAEAHQGAITAISASESEEQSEEFWPEAGAFARVHTNPYKLVDRAEAVRTYNIDG